MTLIGIALIGFLLVTIFGRRAVGTVLLIVIALVIFLAYRALSWDPAPASAPEAPAASLAPSPPPPPAVPPDTGIPSPEDRAILLRTQPPAPQRAETPQPAALPVPALAADGTGSGSRLPLAKDLSPESNQQFLADNAKRPGVTVLTSGLQYRVIKSGNGKSPTPNDIVTVIYRGQFINGFVFDETQAGKTAAFPAGQLIPGWTEALQMMKEGDEWELVIPSNLGYGEAGAGGVVPPDQTLVFDMALLRVGS